MSKTPRQILQGPQESHSIFVEAFDAAITNQDYAWAAFNLNQAFQSLLFQGLIQWRCEIESPVRAFRDAIQVVESAVPRFPEVSTLASLAFEKVPIIGFLAYTPSVNCSALVLSFNNLHDDRLLDSQIAAWLAGRFNINDWEVGILQLRKLWAHASGRSGGGPYNALTTDFLLAAILKRVGYEGNSVHLWKWT